MTKEQQLQHFLPLNVPFHLNVLEIHIFLYFFNTKFYCHLFKRNQTRTEYTYLYNSKIVYSYHLMFSLMWSLACSLQQYLIIQKQKKSVDLDNAVDS